MELESKSFEAEIILQDVFLKTLCSVILSKDILTITSVENPTKQKQFLIATFVGHRSGKSKPKLQFKFLTEDSDVQIELSFVKSETQPDPMLAMGTLINQIKLVKTQILNQQIYFCINIQQHNNHEKHFYL
eukprot:GHVP01047653.1.p1 GENE.GHVP01047653.1~~GHVP01047653.1.p1  ORF type:complete len:143 (+),score=22.15 GHVP01047653.1:38-430(+)